MQTRRVIIMDMHCRHPPTPVPTRDGWSMLKTAHARQDHSPQNMFCSSAPSSEKPDKTTVPRAGSSSVPSSENQDRTTIPRAGSGSVPSSEKQDRTTVPRTGSTVLPLFRETRTQQWPHGAAARTAVGQHGGPSEDHNLHPNCRTDQVKTCSNAEKDDDIAT